MLLWQHAGTVSVSFTTVWYERGDIHCLLSSQWAIALCCVRGITCGKYAMKEKKRERKYALLVRPYWTV